jgi:putative SOS response-associated peptidase YedK
MAIPHPAAHLRFWPVKSLVNSIRNNGPELAAPITLGETEVLF